MSRSNDSAVEQTNSAASGFPPEILLTVDRSRRQTLSEQLRQQLRVAIHQGRLVPGTVLPASRVMARDLAVSRSVVYRAPACCRFMRRHPTSRHPLMSPIR
jgi:GntR family transcriptional regulator/MocR family aminotransferase